MKITINKHLFYIIIILASILGGYLYALNERVDDGFFCTSDVKLHVNNKTLNAAINFHMQNGYGLFILKGNYRESNNESAEVSLLKKFSYSEKNGEYLLTQSKSEVLEVSEKDRGILKEFIPEFYLTNNIQFHHIRIKNLRKGVWILTTAPVPYFVCTDY